MMILVTAATGMFGSRLVGELTAAGAPVRAMVRNEEKARAQLGTDVELVVADMDRPETLPTAMAGIDSVFLNSPMDDRIAERELAVIDAARRSDVRRVVKLFGAVRHEDALGALHGASISALAGSGLRWALVSPNSVMETSLFTQAEAIAETGGMWACAGDGRVGLVAADDVGRAAAAVLLHRENAPDGTDFQLTGPRTYSMAEMAAVLSAATGTTITYHDLPEDEFLPFFVEQTGMPAEMAEIAVVAHFRAWREGLADLVTDTYRELTGLAPTSLADWAYLHRTAFLGSSAAAPADR